MPLLETATLAISPDEHAWSLRELNLPAPDFKGKRRFQIIEVVRGDRLVKWQHDMGPAKSFKANQFNLVGGFVDEQGRGHCFHSVAELREMADELRERKELPDVVDSEPVTAEKWLQAYEDEKDRKRLEAKKQSLFGPKFQKMRY